MGLPISYVILCLEHAKSLIDTENAMSIVNEVNEVVEKEVLDANMEIAARDTSLVEKDNDDDVELIQMIDSIINKLNEKKSFSSNVHKKINSLVNIIGTKFVGDLIGKEYASLQEMNKDTSYMETLHPRTFLSDRNEVLKTFLWSIAPSKDPYSYQVAMVVETIYHMRNNNLILPHSFMSNLIQTFISGSKTVTTINGKLFAGGGDTTYRKWLKQNAPLSKHTMFLKT